MGSLFLASAKGFCGPSEEFSYCDPGACALFHAFGCGTSKFFWFRFVLGHCFLLFVALLLSSVFWIDTRC